MRNKLLLSLVTAVALLMITANGYSQNVGIGQNAPISKLDVKGNLVVGASYGGTAAPTNGAIIQGNVGIGTTSPSALLTIGTSSPVTVDNERKCKNFFPNFRKYCNDWYRWLTGDCRSAFCK